MIPRHVILLDLPYNFAQVPPSPCLWFCRRLQTSASGCLLRATNDWSVIYSHACLFFDLWVDF